MDLIAPEEFARMEQLLADLLPVTEEQETASLLHLHARLQALYQSQLGLQASHDRLMALRSRTRQ